MSKKDKADLIKSADMAAGLLAENQNYFAKYKMSEILAVLAWNYSVKKYILTSTLSLCPRVKIAPVRFAD